MLGKIYGETIASAQPGHKNSSFTGDFYVHALTKKVIIIYIKEKSY
jgi:hypothetical protein